MSNEYITGQVEKIIKDKTLAYPQNISLAAAWIAGNFKGVNLKIIDVSEKSSLADHFLIVSTQNPVQANAMADEMERQLTKHGTKLISREGRMDSDWILIDFDDVIVHLFSENARDVYNLDSLWTEAPVIAIPSTYYNSDYQIPSATLSHADEEDEEFF